jgi:hypothetical protein
MTVPTIAGVNPNSGSTRGDNIVRVEGSGFRLPPPPPPTGYLGGPQPKTVSVKFEGVESEWAYSANDGLILARVPQWRGAYDVPFPLALDVRVANLDDSGIEIPGESVTLADAYQIDRHSLSTESYFQRVIREFQHLFKRHVTDKTFVTVSRDAATAALDDQRLRAAAPAVHLVGPRTAVNRFYSINREEIEQDSIDPTMWMRRRFPVTVDFDFDVYLYADSSRHLFSMAQSVMLMFRDIIVVRVPDDPTDPTGPHKDFEIDMLWPFQPTVEDNEANESDLFVATAGVVIRGVHVDEEAGTIVQRGWLITDNDGEPVAQVQPIGPTGP